MLNCFKIGFQASRVDAAFTLFPIMAIELWCQSLESAETVPIKMTVTSLANVGSNSRVFCGSYGNNIICDGQRSRNKHVLVDLIYGILESPFSFGLYTQIVAPHPIDSINCGRL